MTILYQPLQQDKLEIRLLEFVPGLDHAEFILCNVLLDEAPLFYAISYAWNGHHRTHSILVNGTSIPITKDLAGILSDRHSLFSQSLENDNQLFSVPFIWVDALCINQSDLHERAQQVQQMGKIYQQGSLAVCLEHSDRELDKAASDHLLHRSTCSNPEKIAENMIIPAMHAFFAKAWFRRMWTVQEFVLAPVKEHSVFMGNTPLPLTVLFQRALQLFPLDIPQLTPAQNVLFREGLKQYLTLLDVKLEFANGADPNIFVTLLWIFRDRLASDPRDKIYSLLSLLDKKLVNRGADSPVSATTKPDVDKLLIDYTADIEDVYASVVDAVVSGTGSLNIICASQSPSIFSRTWVPDWADPWRQHSFLTSNMYALFTHVKYLQRDVYRAAGETTAQVFFSNKRTTMRTQGILWDTVSLLLDPLPFSPDPEMGHREWSLHTFNTLPFRLKDRLIRTYGEDSLDEPDPYKAACTYFSMATLGRTFASEDIRDEDYRDFYRNASPDWHVFSRKHWSGTKGAGTGSKQGDVSDFDVRAHQVGYRRKIFVSERGYCGLVPEHVEIGDTVWVLFGCDVPVVLRNMISDQYKLVGEAYVHGLMYGEAIVSLDKGEVQSSWIELI